MVVLDGNFALGCGPSWNGLPLNTHISMYTKTNRYYNERGSRINYVRSSIPHCSNIIKAIYFYKGLKMINVDRNTF